MEYFRLQYYKEKNTLISNISIIDIDSNTKITIYNLTYIIISIADNKLSNIEIKRIPIDLNYLLNG